MHSNIRAGRDVLCSGAKGLIVGGSVQAGEKVIARIIGNPMSTTTSIEVGALPELRNELPGITPAGEGSAGESRQNRESADTFGSTRLARKADAGQGGDAFQTEFD